MTRPELPPGPYLVVGLARSGIAAARMLAGRYYKVIGVDSGTPDAVDFEGDFEVHTGVDGLDQLARAATVVKSPGVPPEAPVIVAARERGLPVIGEVELAWRVMPDNPFVAITGTNGKTTVTELLGSFWPGAVTAGNVGTPLASLAGRLDPGVTVICECSSFQLEDTFAFAPECAVLLNVEEDHLDRHGTLENYRAAKERVFANQTASDVAVLPPGYGEVPGHARRVDYGDFADFVDSSALRLRGPHNRLNAMAASAAAIARGVPEDVVREGLRDFPGVPNRLEEVAEHDGVLFVNDSKATNVASAIVGIESFERGVHVILGGSLKGGGYTGLRDAVAARCTAVYLIGEAAPRIRADLDGVGVPLHDSGDLASAMAAARAAAAPGEVVLLSPACASYNQFKNYEERGEEFRRLAA